MTEPSGDGPSRQDQILQRVAELLGGLQVPLSLGILGAAAEPLTWLRDELELWGWVADVDAVKEVLRHALFAEIEQIVERLQTDLAELRDAASG